MNVNKLRMKINQVAYISREWACNQKLFVYFHSATFVAPFTNQIIKRGTNKEFIYLEFRPESTERVYFRVLSPKDSLDLIAVQIRC